MISSRSLLIISASVALALFSGCATTQPTVATHPDTTITYANYKSFMVLRPSSLAPRNAAATPAVVRQVRQDTEAALIAKGLVKSTAEADLLVLIHGGVSEKLEIDDQGLSYGRFGRGFGNRQELSQHKEGFLYIDLFDGKTRELIWRGSITAEVTDSPTPAQLKAAVETVIARYPS